MTEITRQALSELGAYGYITEPTRSLMTQAEIALALNLAGA